MTGPISTPLLGARQVIPVSDAVLLIGRVLLGLVLIAHGWQKLQQGFSVTSAGFEGMGIPLPDLAAGFSIAVELGGGALLILGLLTPVAAVAVAANMVGAFWWVHRGNGVFAADGGWELVAVIGVCALALGVVPGRLSLDHALFGRARA